MKRLIKLLLLNGDIRGGNLGMDNGGLWTYYTLLLNGADGYFAKGMNSGAMLLGCSSFNDFNMYNDSQHGRWASQLPHCPSCSAQGPEVLHAKVSRRDLILHLSSHVIRSLKPTPLSDFLSLISFSLLAKLLFPFTCNHDFYF